MITYRKVEQKDKEVLVKMERDFYKFYNESDFNKHLKPVNYKDIPESYFALNFDEAMLWDKFFYIAEEDNNIVGAIEAEIAEDISIKDLYKEIKTGHINSLFVYEEYRGKGIGSKLIDEAIKWIKSKNISLCAIGVIADNKQAISMYEKLGFNKERIKMWKQI